MYARDAGLTISLAASAVVGGAYYVCLIATRGRFSDSERWLDEARDGGRLAKDEQAALAERDAFLSVLPLAVAVFGGAFCFVFALLNPLLQVEEVTGAEIHRQLSDGTLVLRVTTIFFAGSLLWKAIIHLRRRGENREFASDMEAIPARLSSDNRRIRDTLQSAIFVAALFTLWLLYAREVRTAWTAFLAYVFAFFSDDWTIMSDYSRVLKGRLLRWHRWRLLVANALLLVPLGVVAWQEFRWWGTLVWFLAIGLLVINRYVFDQGWRLERSQRLATDPPSFGPPGP